MSVGVYRCVEGDYISVEVYRRGGHHISLDLSSLCDFSWVEMWDPGGPLQPGL